VVVPLEAVGIFLQLLATDSNDSGIVLLSIECADSSDDGGFCEGSRGADFLIALSVHD